ncbi:MAG: response regulator transcription factor [Lachnospiraceae bacterium]|nr:response regulator transcription factor [Lachnospiraceae bacterium]
MIKIALCDDELRWREHIYEMLNIYLTEHPNLRARISVFSSGDDLLDAVDQHGAYDLYILDVMMPGLNGIDLGIELRKQGDKGILVYLTSSKEFAVESYVATAFHYLLKPITQQMLTDVMNRAIANLNKRRSKRILVKTKYETTMLVFDDIRYVELEGKALCFHLANGGQITSTSKRIAFSDAISPLLADSRFAQCGASFAVNLFYVKSIEKDAAIFDNGMRVVVPKSACAQLRAKWLDYWFEGEEER